MMKCSNVVPITFPLLAGFVMAEQARYGTFNIASIPAIEIGCSYWSVMGDTNSLKTVQAVVDAVPVLKRGWKATVESAFKEASLAAHILKHLYENPGILQTQLYNVIGEPPDYLQRMVYFMERVGRIKRKKSGRSYKLYPV